MGLPVNNSKGSKSGNKNQHAGPQGSKFITKPGTKAVGATKKPIKTGGSRGS